MATFNYSEAPMAHPKTQIRLLHLLPGEDDAKVQIELATYQFADCPPYVAVSYTWGDTVPTVPITVNGYELRVRGNCWYSLWQLQYHNERRCIWIDSICIDQANTDEKNSQVANMGKIYSKAALAACCLGPGFNLAAAKKLSRPPTSNDTSRTLAAERDSLRELQHRSYFRRIWIKQEIILSKEIRLYCGIDHVDWSTYVHILNSFVAHDVRNLKATLEQHPRSRDLGNNIHKVLVQGRELQHTSRSEHVQPSQSMESSSRPWASLFEILEQYADAECSDRHDKVYALLSLLPQDERAGLDLEIDYNMPLLGLCLDIMKKSIEEYRNRPNDGTVPAGFWSIASKVVQYWIRPELDNAIFTEFASQWSFLPELSQADKFERLTQMPEYAKMEALGRYPIQHHIDILLTSHVHGTESGAYKHYLSDAVRVDQVPMLLLQLMPDNFDINEFFGAEDDFSLRGLPPDEEFKVVVGQVENSLDFSFYLVSPIVEIGDEITVCRIEDPRNPRIYLPIVRPSRNTQETTTTRYHVLLGWALFLGHDGSLQRSPGFEQPAVSGFLMRSDEQGNDLLPQAVKFYLHYKDFVLEAMLVQESWKYLTHPWSHRSHPSFLAESLPQRAATVRSSPEMSERKKGKRRVELPPENARQ